MLISHVDGIDEPERLPDAVLRPEPFLAPGPERSAWPVDDTATVIILSFDSADTGGLREVRSWTQFVDQFDWAGPTAHGARSVRGCFANGGRRVVIAPYVGELDSATLDLVDAERAVATIVAPDVYGRGDECDLGQAASVQSELVRRAEQCGDRLVLLDAPPSFSAVQVREWRLEVSGIDSWFAACYHPWLSVFDPDLGMIDTPPSGHIAGLFSYSDLRYGVQKPPANEPIREIIDVAGGSTSRFESDLLNPIGINLISPERSRGIVVWGARSMSSDPSSASLNHCRSLHMVVRLLRAGLAWVDRSHESPQALWIQLRRDLSRLLELLHAAGVLRRELPEWSSCVQRVGDRLLVVDLTLAGDSSFSRIRVGY